MEKFKHKQFRTSQKEIVYNVLSGTDTFVLMPTGGGKSLCFQVPACVLPGVTIIVSPLIALMENQVSKLKDLGVAAQLLNSSITPKQRSEVIMDLKAKSPKTKLLYVTPELIGKKSFSKST
eukprot:TRINITY_DN16050_c0_g1_i1.p1 TRINITY_DN16050_c0_g1~~TRINITY_DN16050_c0_g1_i1.p1  ORF type:complete len:131 (-),score=25.73 TRINITY_DN16050_c0_g1_i1:77-439(-)